MLNVVVHIHLAATELFNIRRIRTVSNVGKTNQCKMHESR
jgi:hypothetical protein